MKKLCSKYSYAITLLILSCCLALFLSVKDDSAKANANQYLKVTVSDGDSLWKISNKYAGKHSLTNSEFVSWVRKHNEDINDEIYPGEEIVIPVVTNQMTSTTAELASAPEK